MPRLTYLTGLALLLVAGAFRLTDWLVAPPPGVTEANVRRIQEGMALERVEQLLGGGATGFRTGRRAGGRAVGCHFWFSPCGEAAVWVDGLGRVVSAEWVPGSRPRGKPASRPAP